jgi:branched-chain amino acid aminotransferase
MSELIEASNNNTLEEAFGAGTAVGIAMIEEIGYKDLNIKFPKENPVSVSVNETLNAIKTQKSEDKFGWVVEAK